MSKLTARRTMLTTSGLGLALLIAGCSGSGDSDTTGGPASDGPSSDPSTGGNDPSTAPSASTESSPSASTESSSSSSSGSSTGGAEQAKVKIGEKISDPDTEDTIEIISAIRNFPSEKEAETIEEGGEVVLVEVKVTPGQKFGGSIREGSFEISWDGGSDFWNNTTRTLEDELKEADMERFEKISRRDGGSATGWIAYAVREKADTYTLEYTRSAAKIIGQDETIDEFSEQVEIPAA